MGAADFNEGIADCQNEFCITIKTICDHLLYQTFIDLMTIWLDNIFNGIKYQTTQILEGNVLNLAFWINETDCVFQFYVDLETVYWELWAE